VSRWLKVGVWLSVCALVALVVFGAGRWWGSLEQPLPPGMVRIPGGEFTMGAADEYAWPEERPAHRVRITEFALDETEVTNQAFAKFVKATGYQTADERTPDLSEFLGSATVQLDPQMLARLSQAGGMVFKMPEGPTDLSDPSQWWEWVPGAQWRHPQGPASTIEGRDQHPVLQVSWDDATAFCRWQGKRLPTEAEWERAARGGLDGHSFVWGDTQPNETHALANIWQGMFPSRNTEADGFGSTAPVKSFQPNAYGLHDMAGNAWEWTADWYDRRAYQRLKTADPQQDPTGPPGPVGPESRRTQRGGSFMCHESYCARYRPSSRQGAPSDIGTSHSGFRCAQSLR
jgi:formylglycine-generating enzyme required for sulfatase activity